MNRSSKSRSVLRTLSVFIVSFIMLFLMNTVTAFAAVTTQDGIQVTMTAETPAGTADGTIIASISVTNTNSFSVTDLSMKLEIPEGYQLSAESSAQLAAATLDAGETKEMQASFVPAPAETTTVVTTTGVQSTTTAPVQNKPAKNPAAETAPKTGDTPIFWLFAILISGGAMVTAAKLGKKNVTKITALLLSVSIGSSVISASGLLRSKANAADDTRVINIWEFVGNTQIDAIITYTLPDGTVTVFFDSNRGTDVEPQIIPRNTCAAQPETPVREGSTFIGWYFEDQPYDFNEKVRDDLTLLAMWDTPEEKTEEEAAAEENGKVSGVDDSPEIFCIANLEVDPAAGIAKADVGAPDNCAFVVRFIDEEVYFSEAYPDNKQYIAGGDLYASHVVAAGTSLEEVTAEINGAMPQNFVAEAILLDSEGQPLCNPVTNIDHSRRGEEFNAKTVEDFPDANAVLNFDEDNTNNFGVLADDVKILSADKVEKRYDFSIEDDDEFFTSYDYAILNPSEELHENDKVFIHDAEGQQFLFKVGSITTEDGLIVVVPVRADDPENGYVLTDFYNYIKVDMTVENAGVVPAEELASQDETAVPENNEAAPAQGRPEVAVPAEAADATEETVTEAVVSEETVTDAADAAEEADIEAEDADAQEAETTEISAEDAAPAETEAADEEAVSAETTGEQNLSYKNAKASVAPQWDGINLFGPLEFSSPGELSVMLDPKFDSDHFEFEVCGELGLAAHFSIKWDAVLFGDDYFEFEATREITLSGKLSAMGKWGGNEDREEELTKYKESHSKEVKLGKYMIPTTVVGMDAFCSVKMCFDWSLSAGLEAEIKSTDKKGFTYNTKDGKSTVADKTVESSIVLKGKVELQFGPEPELGLELLGGVVQAKIGCFIGAKAEAEANILVARGGTEIHGCRLCVNGEIKAVVEAEASLCYEVTDHLKGDIGKFTICQLEWKLFNFYVSVFNDSDSQFGGHLHAGRGECPNKKYKATIQVKNGDTILTNADVTIINKDNVSVKRTARSNEAIYLPESTYIAKTKVNGHEYQTDFTVSSGGKVYELPIDTDTNGTLKGQINGSVVDASTGNPIANATITIYSGSVKVDTLKTDSRGTYTVKLGQGDYKLELKATGYVTASQNFSLRCGEVKPLESTMLAKSNQHSIMGGVYGQITNAATGGTVSGVNIKITKGWNNAGGQAPVVEMTTDANGNYAYKKTTRYGVDFGLNAGNYTISISKDGFISSSFNITIVGGQDKLFNSVITPVGGTSVYRIVLRWGETPSDLDSHMNAVYNGSADHVYYRRKDGSNASLDVDDTSSYGPETIKINDISRYSGNVLYSVHDYSNKFSNSSTALSSSRAVIEVYKGAALLETFYVPTGKVGTVWNVFYITPDERIVPVNSFANISEPDNVRGSTT